ncbi:MAG: hypothetical protein AAF198_06160 [Pseudomonadota bacterium]
MTAAEKRRKAWQEEKQTNMNGLAHLADRAITILDKQIEIESRAIKKEASNE